MLLYSCGGNGSGSEGSDAASDDSVASQKSVLAKPPVDAAKRKHNADNFFAINCKDSGLYVGNNVEMMTAVPVDSCYSPVLAPDGNMMAYTDCDTSARMIHLLDISTGEDSKLDFGPFHCMSSDFDAEGRMLAFTRINLRDVSNVCLYDVRNRSYQLVSYEYDTDGDYNPTFSPDGAYLVFHNMRKVKIYSMKNGSPKLWQNIDCENFCQRNDLALTPDCKFQMTSDHKSIVFSCKYFPTDTVEISSLYRLIVYDIATSEVHDVFGDEFACADFQVSDDNSIYYIQVSPDSSRYMYMTDISKLSPVRLSPAKISDNGTFSIAY